jgi:hypothetical protein
MIGLESIEAFVKKLKDYGLASNEIDKILNALRIIYVSEASGYWGGIPSVDFDEEYLTAVNMLVRLGLVERMNIIQGRQAYRCSSLGNSLASKFIQRILEENRTRIDNLLNQFPPKLVAFWSQYGIEGIHSGKFEGKAMRRGKVSFFVLCGLLETFR